MKVTDLIWRLVQLAILFYVFCLLGTYSTGFDWWGVGQVLVVVAFFVILLNPTSEKLKNTRNKEPGKNEPPKLVSGINIKTVNGAMLLGPPIDPGNNGWFPAATAPKDGSWFWIVDKQGGMAWSPYELASWQIVNWHKFDDRPFESGSQGYFGLSDTSEEAEFDWWRPLPKLPKL